MSCSYMMSLSLVLSLALAASGCSDSSPPIDGAAYADTSARVDASNADGGAKDSVADSADGHAADTVADAAADALAADSAADARTADSAADARAPDSTADALAPDSTADALAPDSTADALAPDSTADSLAPDSTADSHVDGFNTTGWTMKSTTLKDSASSGTPDSYFFTVDAGSPIAASITGGGSGRWWVNVYGGNTNTLYCSQPSCQVMLDPKDTVVIVTAVTDAIGYYSLTVQYSGKGL